MKPLAALALTLAFAGLTVAPCAADDQEAQIGRQVYAQLAQKGEIVPRPNPLYSVLDPIANRIKKVADPQYTYPFNFIVVHEKSPNAFAVPGGNVYVTDSLIHFVKYQEELAGVLCHETSHDIHHDVVNLNGKAQGTAAIIGIIGALTGANNSGLGQLAQNLAYSAQTARFSRKVETAADLKGSETCAQAGYNPYGMIWLFDAFEKSGNGGNAEFLSDHPRDDHRIADLENHFKENPDLFGRFSSAIKTATPLHVP